MLQLTRLPMAGLIAVALLTSAPAIADVDFSITAATLTPGAGYGVDASETSSPRLCWM